ncbi:17677_t:CDS:2, partial [Racocetra persica]
MSQEFGNFSDIERKNVSSTTIVEFENFNDIERNNVSSTTIAEFENFSDIERNNVSSTTIVEVDNPINSPLHTANELSDSNTINTTNNDIEDTIKFDNNISKHLSIWRKRLILLIVSIAAMISPMADTILYPALVQICSDFQAPEIFVNVL